MGWLPLFKGKSVLFPDFLKRDVKTDTKKERD